MNRSGFSLVGLLVAAALFVAAVAGFNYLLRAGSGSIKTASRLSQAVCLAQSKMETFRGYDFDRLPHLNNRLFADGRGKISVTPILADLLSLELELQWDEKKLPVKMVTLRSRYD